MHEVHKTYRRRPNSGITSAARPISPNSKNTDPKISRITGLPGRLLGASVKKAQRKSAPKTKNVKLKIRQPTLRLGSRCLRVVLFCKPDELGMEGNSPLSVCGCSIHCNQELGKKKLQEINECISCLYVHFAQTEDIWLKSALEGE